MTIFKILVQTLIFPPIFSYKDLPISMQFINNPTLFIHLQSTHFLIFLGVLTVSMEIGSGSQLMDVPDGSTNDEMNPVVASILQNVDITLHKSYKKALNSDSKQTALKILRKEQPNHFLSYYDIVNEHLDKVFQPALTAWVSPYPMSSFTNVPRAMQKWADDYFSCDISKRPRRPLSIIIEGASGTGKTMWARSLGKHNYLPGPLHLHVKNYSNDAEYNVIDNVNPQVLKYWNQLIGAKRDWQSDCRYGKPVLIKGGIPAIVLCNPGVGSSYIEFLNKPCNEDLKSWTLVNATFIVLEEPLFAS
ncbi:hypothetical protein M8C21_033208 [Ambrosia artemisiifolia]|uniref:Geminivirus AL1 replication-associated protein central domain-containing protein n=1 Tax=Ambrosia artemisiifolia TaxID=4212 RepID=A0AAD5BZK0_AMBAR|nr:hypothetical protein M8C21_033208 [Ambrosia artemisiifolia]